MTGLDPRVMPDLSGYRKEELQAFLRELQAQKEELEKRAQLSEYRPYPKQVEFHALGLTKRERMLAAGNQLGKTFAAAAELAMHLTGLYPKDWQGIRFPRATSWLAGSESGELTRDGMQRLLLGPPQIEEAWGTGLIPGDYIVSKPKRRPGIKDAVDSIVVKNVNGGQSVVQFKSFDQGRSKWQATTVDGVWLDEEPPWDVYEEAITRTNKTNGPVMITFTPLKGMSDVVRKFFQEPGPDRGLVMMTIDDVGHYTEEEKQRIINSYDPVTRDARTKGIPVLGSGLVFPVPDELIEIKPFQIPDHWPRLGALDFGWDHPTAAVEIAWDRDSDTVYVIREHRLSKATPKAHAMTLRDWGRTLPWVWPHDGNKADMGSGEQLAAQYRGTGMNVMPTHVTFPDGSNGVEAGIMEMLTRMNDGRFKVFTSCQMWFTEKSLYHRKDGLIVKEGDDLMAATRYAIMGKRFAKVSTRRRDYGRQFAGNVALGTGEVTFGG